MKIKYWKNFSKRRNSTKQPAAVSATEIDVDILEPCSTETPDFILSVVDTSINYAQAFGHYYYVTDRVILDGPRMQISCDLDKLASAKSDILSATCLVKRSSSNYDIAIRDDLVAISTNKTSQIVQPLTTTPFSNKGMYVLSVVNNKSSGNGISTYLLDYKIDQDYSLAGLFKWLNGDGYYGNEVFTDIQSFAITQFSDVFGCIRYLKWIPIEDGAYLQSYAVGGDFEQVYIGKYPVAATNSPSGVVDGYRLVATPIYQLTISFDLTSNIGSDFRKCTPYTSIDLFLPFYGMLSLPTEILARKFDVHMSIDFSTGDIFVEVFNNDSEDERLVASVSYNASVNIPISQIGRTAGTFIESGLNLAGSFAALDAISAVRSGLGVMSAIASNGINVKGNTEGRAYATETEVFVNITSMNTTNPSDLIATHGRPCEQILPLSNLSGYVQTQNASISTHLTPSETEAVNAALDSGIYLE